MNDWEKVVSFHGHPCCLLAIGYRATKVALEKLGINKAKHYDLAAVVENRTCAADAVQMLSGCTFGKKNFVYKDNGKYAFTFARAGWQQALRVSLKSGILSKKGDKFISLMEKVANDTATEEEREEFYRHQEPLMKYILEGPVEEIFEVKTVVLELPDTPLSLRMVRCSRCGEDTMETRVRVKDGRFICAECYENTLDG